MERVFVLGSCVSRDAFEFIPGVFELACYLARTSMASIGMQPIADVEVRGKVASIQSSFQRRMLLNDLDKTTLDVINATPHDILLIDLIDERFNLVASDQSLFSFSGELANSGLDLGDRAIIKPDTDEFLSLWAAGFARLLSSVDNSKVVLNRAYWAEQFPDGTDASSLGWIRRSNAQLQRLYDTVDSHWEMRQIEYPREVVVADPKHRWGVAPYHYTHEFYSCTITKLNRLAGG